MRWRLHLVRHRTALKNRVHATLIAFGKPCPVSDLFGSSGRQLLTRLELPDPWSATVNASLALIENLDGQIAGCERELRALGAELEYVPLLMSAPGIASVRLHDRGGDRRHRSSRWSTSAGSLRMHTVVRPCAF